MHLYISNNGYIPHNKCVYTQTKTRPTLARIEKLKHLNTCGPKIHTLRIKNYCSSIATEHYTQTTIQICVCIYSHNKNQNVDLITLTKVCALKKYRMRIIYY